jgi:hypothetical protein
MMGKNEQQTRVSYSLSLSRSERLCPPDIAAFALRRIAPNVLPAKGR